MGHAVGAKMSERISINDNSPPRIIGMNMKPSKPTIDEILDNLPRYKFSPRLVIGRKSRWTKRNYWQKVEPKTEKSESNPEYTDAPFSLKYLATNISKIFLKKKCSCKKKKK